MNTWHVAPRKLEWPRFGDAFLDERIQQLYEGLRKADFAGDKEAVATRESRSPPLAT